MVRFTKMEGAGNDFVVFDATRNPVPLTAARIARLADRHFGIGCDQVLVVERAAAPDVDFVYRIYNADGGEVEQCGNGARAFVRFVHERGLTEKRTIRVSTRSGVIAPELLEDGTIRVDMGAPRLLPAAVPFDASGLPSKGAARAPEFDLRVNGDTLSLAVLSMGNPHAVLSVEDVARAEVSRIGPLVEHHARFPQRVNVGFMQIIDRHRIALRVWERGVGETLACGTGACAAAVFGIASGRIDTPVAVETRGGTLTIEWHGEEQSPVFLSGPARTVYEGDIDLERLDARA